MRVKRILCMLLAAALLLLSLAGCGAENQADTDAVAAALDKFRACKSFTVVQRSEAKQTVMIDKEELVYNGIIATEISIITSPVPQMKTTTIGKMEYGAERDDHTRISYIIPEDVGYAEYFSDDNMWYKVSTEQADALEGIGADYVTSMFFVERAAFRKAGESSLESGKASRYDGALKGDELVSMLEANGFLSSISTMSENQQAKIKENLAKDLDDVTVSVWIDEATGYPVRFELSLTGILKDMEKSINKTLGNKNAESQWAITDYVISMTVGEFDSVKAFELPPEAASAEPYDYEQAAQVE